MMPSTLDAIRAILKSDHTLPPDARNSLLRTLRQGPVTQPKQEAQPRIVRRAEAARILSVSLRAIDAWASEGLLTKVKLPGRKRAAGFRETDVLALIEGGRP